MSKVYKKIIALFLCLSMVFATACGGAGKDSSDSGKSSDKNDKKEKVKVTVSNTKKAIEREVYFNNTYLIGGATAKLFKNFPNSKIIYGKNRNDTSMKIADAFFKNSKSIFLAKNGDQRFSELIDCVTLAPFAANEKSPIIFASTKNNLTKSEKNFFNKLNPNKITLIGGGLHHKYDEIIGKTPAKKDYVLLNVPQINQNKAGLPMGCEAASLLQCLHYKNIKTNTNINQFIKEMPLAKDNKTRN